MSRRLNSERLPTTRTGVLKMYDNIAYLIKDGARTYDTYLNEHIATTRRMVYVQPRSVYNSEFYNASILGLHPSITLTLTNREDYEGEKLVEFEGKTYEVIRADWKAQRDSITLVLEEKTNPGTSAPTPTTTETTEGN